MLLPPGLWFNHTRSHLKECLWSDVNDLNFHNTFLLCTFFTLKGLDQTIRSIEVEGRSFIAERLNDKDSQGKRKKISTALSVKLQIHKLKKK